jgi:hypothetical protein
MRFQCLVWLFLTVLVYGQAAAPPAPSFGIPPQGAAPPSDIGPKVQAPEAQVGPNDTVITLTNFCADSSKQGDACKTVITRAEFEKLSDALQPGMSPTVRRQLATAYSRMLKMSEAAEKRGLEKDPKFEEKMYFARIQVLSQELSSALQDDANKVSDSDIEEYYKKNEASYEQATLARIFIPRAKQIPPPAVNTEAGAKSAAVEPPTAEQQKAAQEAMDKVAEDIHARAFKGEDPDALQKEAYAASGLPGNAPATKMEKVRRTSLPKNHVAVMDLKVGEVSELISDANSGHFVYKMISKETLSLDTEKTDIRGVISGQRYRDSMQGFQGDVDLNDAYFGPPQNRPMPPTRGPMLPQPQQGANTPH